MDVFVVTFLVVFVIVAVLARLLEARATAFGGTTPRPIWPVLGFAGAVAALVALVVNGFWPLAAQAFGG